MLRDGNVHSAKDWRTVLAPVVARYQGRNLRRYFRADAAFANPELYEYLEAEGFEYAKDSVIYVIEFWREALARERGEKPDIKVILCWDLLRFLRPADTEHHEFKLGLTETSEVLRNADLLIMEINTWNPREATHHISYTEAKLLVAKWNPELLTWVV